MKKQISAVVVAKSSVPLRAPVGGGRGRSERHAYDLRRRFGRSGGALKLNEANIYEMLKTNAHGHMNVEMAVGSARQECIQQVEEPHYALQENFESVQGLLVMNVEAESHEKGLQGSSSQESSQSRSDPQSSESLELQCAQIAPARLIEGSEDGILRPDYEEKHSGLLLKDRIQVGLQQRGNTHTWKIKDSGYLNALEGGHLGSQQGAKRRTRRDEGPPVIPLGGKTELTDEEDAIALFSKELLASAVNGAFPAGTTIEEVEEHVFKVLQVRPVYVHPKEDKTFVIKLEDTAQVTKMLESVTLFKGDIPAAIGTWDEDSSKVQKEANRRLITVELPGLELQHVMLAYKMVVTIGQVVESPNLPTDLYRSRKVSFKVLIDNIQGLPERVMLNNLTYHQIYSGVLQECAERNNNDTRMFMASRLVLPG